MSYEEDRLSTMEFTGLSDDVLDEYLVSNGVPADSLHGARHEEVVREQVLDFPHELGSTAVGGYEVSDSQELYTQHFD